MTGKVFSATFELAARLQSSFSGAFDSANTKLSKLHAQSREIKGSMAELEKAATQSALAGKYFAESYAKLGNQLAKTERQQKALSRAMGIEQRVSDMRGNARGAMMGAVEMGAVLYGPAKMAVDFESAMGGVAKQVDGARDAQGNLTSVYVAMEKQVRATALEMGVLPSTMAEIYAMTAKMGVKGSENIGLLAKYATAMGPAFEMDRTKVVEQMAKIGNALGISLESKDGINALMDLADTINYLDDQSVAAGQDIMDIMKRSAGMIREGGLAPTLAPKTLAALATGMLEMGETSETAATALNAMFVKFAAAPTEAKSFQSALASMGWSAEELQSGVIKDAEKTIFKFFDDLSKLDNAKRNNVMAEIFGKEHIDNLSKLAGGTQAFTQRIKDANAAAAKGSVMKEWANQQKTAAAKIAKLTAAAADLGITVGTFLLPALSDLAMWGAEKLAWVTRLTADNKGLASTVVTVTAGVLALAAGFSGLFYIATIIGGPFATLYTMCVKYEVATKAWTAAQWLWNAAMTAGKWLLSVGAIAAHAVAAGIAATATGAWTAAQWLWNAAMTANPIGLLIVGIGLLVGAGIWLYENWDTVKQFWTTLWNDPMAALQMFVDGIKARFGPVLAWLEEKWTAIKSMFSSGVNAGGSIPAGSVDVASNALGGIYSKGAFLTTFAENSAEAAIPLDGSSRAVGLWQQAGQMLGVGGGSGSVFNP